MSESQTVLPAQQPSRTSRALLLLAGVVISLGCGALSAVLVVAVIAGKVPSRAIGIGVLAFFLVLTWYGIYCIQRVFQREPRQLFTALSASLSASRSPAWMAVYPVMGIGFLVAGFQSLGTALIALVPVILICSAIHELAHAAMATALGARVTRVEVWPLRIDRNGSGWRVRWRGAHGGLVATEAPPAPQRTRYMMFVAAGPVADLMLLALGVMLLRSGVLPESDTGLSWSVATYVLIGTAGLQLLMDLNPWGRASDGLPTDAAQLIGLWRMPEKLAQVDWRLLMEVVAARHPSEWKLSIEECLPLVLPPSTDDGLTLVYVTGAALDLERFDLVHDLLRRDRSGASAATLSEMNLCEACVTALLAKEPSRARALFESGAPDCVDATYPLLAEAAVLVAEGRHEEARPKWEQWRIDTAKAAHPGQREGGNRWVLLELARYFDVPGNVIGA